MASSIYADYSQGTPQSKQDLKEVLDQMVGVMIDFSECYAKTTKAMNHPQYSNLKVNERLGPRIKNWNNEIKNANMNHRRNLNRLMSDIRYIIGSMEGSNELFKELELSSKPLKDHWDSQRVDPNQGKSKQQLDDIMRILGVTPTTAYVHHPQQPVQHQVIQQAQHPPQQYVQPARPAQNEPMQKVYYIDPVTGQKVERLEHQQQPRTSATRVIDSRSMSPSPRQSTVISQTQYSNPQNPQNPQTTRVIIQEPQPQAQPRIIRHDPQPPTRVIQVEPQPPTRVIQAEPQQRVIRQENPQESRVIIRHDQQAPVQRQTPPASNTRIVRVENHQTPPTTIRVQDANNEYDYASRLQRDERSAMQSPKVVSLVRDVQSCRETKLEVDDQPTKIEVSQDGNRIYYGGESFGMLEYDSDGFVVPHGRVFSNRVSDINPIRKSTASQSPDSRFKNSHAGDVLIGEFNDWNVHLYDSELQELGKLSSKQGSKNKLPRTYAAFKTTSAKPYACLWYSGTQNISEVDTGTYVNLEINNYWIMKDKPVEPLGAHLSKHGDIIGIGLYDGVHNSLHYYSPRSPSTVLAYDRPDIFPYCKSWQAIDGHQEGRVFFIGGSSNPDQHNETAYLIALTLDENMDVLRYKEFPPISGHDTIRVIKTYSDDWILAATNKAILLMKWLDDQFVTIKQIPTSSPVIDCVLSDDNRYIGAPIIYSLMKDGTCSAFNLGDEKKIRAIMGKPTRRNKKVYDMGSYMSTPKADQSQLYDPLSASKLHPDERRRLKKAAPRYAQDYKDYRLKQIMIQEEGLGRVQVTDNELTVYCGQRDLRVLETRDGKYVMNSGNWNVKSFVDMLLLRNKELVILERSTGDLVKYDTTLKEIKRLQGRKAIEGPGSEFTSYVYAGSEVKYLWTPGDNSLVLVNPDTFGAETVQSFFGKQGEKTMPIAAIANNQYKKYVGLYLTDSDQMISMMDLNSGTIIRKKVLEINPSVPFLYSLENSAVDENIFFAGGTTNRDVQQGSAVIQAITCDSHLACIDELELKAGDNVQRCTIGWITRAEGRDVLFAAVNQAVFVIEWTGTHFCILNYIDEVHTKLPTALCSPNPFRIYSSSARDGYINKIDFRAD